MGFWTEGMGSVLGGSVYGGSYERLSGRDLVMEGVCRLFLISF